MLTYILARIAAADIAAVEAAAPAFGSVEVRDGVPVTVVKRYVNAQGEVFGVIATNALQHIATAIREYAHGRPAVLDEQGNVVTPATAGRFPNAVIEEFDPMIDPGMAHEILTSWNLEPVE